MFTTFTSSYVLFFTMIGATVQWGTQVRTVRRMLMTANHTSVKMGPNAATNWTVTHASVQRATLANSAKSLPFRLAVSQHPVCVCSMNVKTMGSATSRPAHLTICVVVHQVVCISSSFRLINFSLANTFKRRLFLFLSDVAVCTVLNGTLQIPY